MAARVVTRVLGRQVVGDLEVLEWEPPRGFSYGLRAPGRPHFHNVRVFTPARGGTHLTGTTDIPLRRSPAGVLDLIMVLAVWVIFRRGIKNLPTTAQAELGRH